MPAGPPRTATRSPRSTGPSPTTPASSRYSCPLRDGLSIIRRVMTDRAAVARSVVGPGPARQLAAPAQRRADRPRRCCDRGARPRTRRAHRQSDPRTVLLTGGKMTKALVLARAFHAAGHRVVLADSARYRLTGHRFSRAVDRFHTLPTPDDAGYAARWPGSCPVSTWTSGCPSPAPPPAGPTPWPPRRWARTSRSMHLDPDAIDTVDDKYRFARAAAAPGAGRARRAPHHGPPAGDATSNFARARAALHPQEHPLRPGARRLDLTRLPRAARRPRRRSSYVRSLPISEATPWILQEFVAGPASTARTARSATVQRAGCTACCASSAWQINYAAMDRKARASRHGSVRFVGALGLTGQVSFDFIETDDGTRGTRSSATRAPTRRSRCSHDHPDVARALPRRGRAHGTIRPLATSRPTYWTLPRAVAAASATPARTSGRSGGSRRSRAARDAIFRLGGPAGRFSWSCTTLQIPVAAAARTCGRGRDWHARSTSTSASSSSRRGTEPSRCACCILSGPRSATSTPTCRTAVRRGTAWRRPPTPSPLRRGPPGRRQRRTAAGACRRISAASARSPRPSSDDGGAQALAAISRRCSWTRWCRRCSACRA